MNVVVYRPPLRLEDLAAYRKLRLAADIKRQAYQRMMAQVRQILSKLAAEYCETELDIIEDLQRQVRLLAKGTPLTEALTPEDKDPLLRSDPTFSQQQHDARTVLLKNAYRKCCQLCHPDKGGDHEVFHEVQAALEMRDLERLIAIYLSIVEGRNLYWQQDEGVYHVGTEYQRYHVKLELMKNEPGWQAARLFIAGAVNNAVNLVRQDLADQIAALYNEIHYLNTKGKQNGEERTSEGQEVDQDREGYQIEGEGSEGQEAEPAGSSAPG